MFASMSRLYQHAAVFRSKCICQCCHTGGIFRRGGVRGIGGNLEVAAEILEFENSADAIFYHSAHA